MLMRVSSQFSTKKEAWIGLVLQLQELRQIHCTTITHKSKDVEIINLEELKTSEFISRTRFYLIFWLLDLVVLLTNDI